MYGATGVYRVALTVTDRFGRAETSFTTVHVSPRVVTQVVNGRLVVPDASLVANCVATTVTRTVFGPFGPVLVQMPVAVAHPLLCGTVHRPTNPAFCIPFEVDEFVTALPVGC